MSNNRNFTPAPKNEMDHPRLALRGIKHKQGKGFPNLKVALLDNIARLRCYTGIEGEKSISAKLEPRHLEALAIIIRDHVIPNREDHKRKIVMKSLWIGGKRRDEPGVTETIVVGRMNGKAFISLYGYNTSKVVFPFTYGDMLSIENEDGPIDPVDESNICALAWVNSIMRTVYPAMVKNYKHPEPKDFNNGGNGGGGYGNNNRGGNGGGWGNNGGGNNNSGGGAQNNDFDDDIAF